MNNFVLKGNICYSVSPTELITRENAYVVCTDGKCGGVFDELPAEYSSYPVRDCGDKLIIPGLIDLHIHASQYSYRGLGSDVAGGQCESLFRAITDTIQVSKLRWRLVDQSLKPITFEEAFYMATKGGGEFFGRVGSFEEGYEFDAVILDDSHAPHPQPMSIIQRLERATYLSLDLTGIKAKYVAGEKIEIKHEA